uniref:Uncharacterized protein n=1 Tax=Romanomermis culicivorax TaxID=13658 RepID=A0A915LB54_ROMCU
MGETTFGDFLDEFVSTVVSPYYNSSKGPEAQAPMLAGVKRKEDHSRAPSDSFAQGSVPAHDSYSI